MASLGKNGYYNLISRLRKYRSVPEHPAATTQSHVSGKNPYIALQEGCRTCDNGNLHTKCLKERGIRYSVKYLNVEVINLRDSAIMPRADQRHSRADGAQLIDL